MQVTNTWTVWAVAALFGPGAVSAQLQPLVMTDSLYTITYDNPKLNAAWSTFPSIPGAVYSPFAGFMKLDCQAGTSNPDMETLAKTYSAAFGGNITVAGSGKATLGKYEFNWQDFNYDSLPILRAEIKVRARVDINLKNGKIRAYYVLSAGKVFAMAVLPATILPFGSAPNPMPDAESALMTLNIFPSAGIRGGFAASRGPGIWTQDGMLGGEWPRGMPPLAIECYNGRGAFVGMAKPSGSPGVWELPAGHGGLALKLRMPDGSLLHHFAHP